MMSARAARIARYAPPRKRRSTPRRGCVIDPAFVAWMHANNICLVRRKGFNECVGRDTFHHVRRLGSPKNDRRGLILCLGHHEHDFGPNSIERIGKARFQRQFGIDIEAAILEYNERYEEDRRLP